MPSEEKVTILTFDPGEKFTGFAFVTNEYKIFDLNILAYGHIKFNNFKKLAREIDHLIQTHKPDFVGFEKTNSKMNGIYNIIIETACHKARIPLIACYVPNIRKQLVGNEFASKSQTNTIIKSKTSMLANVISKHALDAIAVGLFLLGK